MRRDALAVSAYVVATIDEGACDRDMHHAGISQGDYKVGLVFF
jgi:hypothetical protein